MDNLAKRVSKILKQEKKIKFFRKIILRWGEKHFQIFPWRTTDDPYKILMAEIMLHRTQAKQVLPVYKKFIQRFPNIDSLTEAKTSEINTLMASLGLKWRINLVKQIATFINNNNSSKIPSNKSLLLKLPGVSEYIASAVLCFSWNHPEPIIDTNTMRIVCRYFGIICKDHYRRNKQFRKLMGALLVDKRAKDYNYALLDFGHEICTKRRPQCPKCPVSKHCVYWQKGHKIKKTNAQENRN